MRRRYIYFLLTYFHNSSKKEHITKYSIKAKLNCHFKIQQQTRNHHSQDKN